MWRARDVGSRVTNRATARRRASLFLGVLAALLSFRALAGQARARMSVLVSILPQAFVVERIAGSRVAVEVLLPPGQSPATYTVSAVQMARLSQARLYFRIGVPFERVLLPKLRSSAKGLRIIDTREGIRLRRMERHEHRTERREVGDGHGAGQGHESGGGSDPHTWLDPSLVITQAATIRDALSDSDPAGRALYAANTDALQRDLRALDARLAAMLAPLKGKTLMVFHPSWGYFADAYGLKQEPVEIEGKSPSARQLAQTIAEARAEQVRAIFVQPQFDKRLAATIARAIGGVVVPLDPLARDYLANLERIAQTVRDALSDQK